jgi:hypothetical protein
LLMFAIIRLSTVGTIVDIMGGELGADERATNRAGSGAGQE